MRKSVIVDIDGTVADIGKGQPGRRSPYDWRRVGEDTPIAPIVELVRILRVAGHQIVFVSGRDEVCRLVTQHWLIEHGVSVGFGACPGCDRLYMRPAGDFRPDEQIKAEIFKRDIEPAWDVAYVLDDRSKVVRMWRDLGLTVLAVADGDF
jgi:hypothetical protein